MKIHDEMSQISVPEGLDEKTHQSILRAEKTVQKNRFRKKCTWSVLSCLVIIFGIIQRYIRWRWHGLARKLNIINWWR